MQTTILELKNGRFRYWFASDKTSSDMPEYPVTGTYTTKGGNGTMEIKIASGLYVTEEWKSMRYEGEVILWPLRLLGPPVIGRPPHNILVRTRRNPEEIWKQERKQEK